MPSADDPLRTTDHAPTPVPETPTIPVATDARLAPEIGNASPSLDAKATATFHLKQDLLEDGSSATPSEPPFIPGYEIEGVLGHGGMGVVYKARHLALKRTVALKMVLAGGHAGPRELARFRTEAEAVARLQHSNIVQVFEVGEADKHPYCALEFIEGGNLAGKINGKPLPARESARLVEALARAMQLAHSRNVVHRNLKPANILLTADGTPKITDFGLARQMDSDSSETRDGAVMGTPSYMAPEQASGRAHEAGPAADLYALGAILYDCLTGRPPFKGSTLVETLDQVRTQEPIPPSRWQTSVPPDLETICLKCLRKEPEQRYASAAELADELGRYQRGEPIQARPVSRLERAWRWCRRNPLPAALLGTVAVLLLVGTAVATGLLVYAGGQEAAAAKEAELRRTADEEKDKAENERRKARIEEAKAKEQEELKQRALVLAQLLRVEALYEREPGRAKALLYDLDACPIRLRDTAWRFYERACSRWELGTLQGHTDLVFGVAFSPDGQTLASASFDQTVRLWDVKTGKVMATLRGKGGRVFSVAFSPDGQTLASTSGLEVRLWDVKTGQAGATLKGTGLVFSVAFSPDGHTLASASYDRTVRLWDVKTGQARGILKGHKGPVLSVAFSPDGRTLATAGEDRNKLAELRLWDVKTGQPRGILQGHTEGVNAVAFSPDGRSLATGSSDKTVRLWDVQTGQTRATLTGHSYWVQAVAFSPDGQTLASAGANTDRTVRLWDVKTGQPRVILQGHTDGLQSVAFSPDGQTLASASADRTVRLWDVSTGQASSTVQRHAEGGHAVAYSPDGLTLASASSVQTVRLWDVKTGQARATLRGAMAVAFSPDGQTIASGSRDSTVLLWDAKNGQARATLRGHTGEVRSVAFSPDGQTLASAAFNQTVHLWDVRTGAAKATLKHTSSVLSVAFSPDGQTLAGGTADKVVQLWDVRTGLAGVTLKGHTGQVWSVAFSPDGQTLASGCLDETVRLWDARTGQARATLRGHTGEVRSVAFSPDGQTLASTSDDQTVLLWDVKTGQPTATLRGHTDQVFSVAFSSDGRSLASDSADDTVRLWDTRPGPTRAIFQGHTTGITCMAVSPDGQRVFCWDSEGQVHAWRLADGQRTDASHPPPPVRGTAATSPDGSVRAEARGYGIVLIDVEAGRRDHEERLALEPLNRAFWHRQQAEQAEQDSNWFAAEFHLRQLLSVEPRNADVKRRHAAALDKGKRPPPMELVPDP